MDDNLASAIAATQEQVTGLGSVTVVVVMIGVVLLLLWCGNSSDRQPLCLKGCHRLF